MWFLSSTFFSNDTLITEKSTFIVIIVIKRLQDRRIAGVLQILWITRSVRVDHLQSPVDSKKFKEQTARSNARRSLNVPQKCSRGLLSVLERKKNTFKTEIYIGIYAVYVRTLFQMR